MMDEIWKPVTGYETLYHVSNLGRIKSIGKRHGRKGFDRILIPYNGKYGHGRIQLCRSGTKIKALVHRLVAHEFIGPGPIGHEVNHIDFDPTNNRVDNLEWVTHRQNIVHSRHRLANKKGEDHGCAKITNENVVAIRAHYAKGGISFAKLGKLYGINAQQCHKVVRRLAWAHI